MFSYLSRGDADGIILFDGESIAEIRGLRLANLRCRPGGALLIGEEVPLPLYWQQYINHEDSERNAGSNGFVRSVRGGDILTMECRGANGSGSIESRVIMEIHFDPHHSAFDYSFDSLFTLHASRRWTVTPNQSHGEIGFCDLWPAGAFVAARGGRKKYSSCLVEQSGRSIRLPHLHADTGARENILLLPGDKFGWVLEEENPVVEILGPEGVYAGLCAYMWDAHFGLRASGLHNGTELRGPAEFHARFRLSSLGREEGEDWWKRASAASEPELSTMPVVEPGVNRFVRTMADAAAAGEVAWPWSREQEGEGSFARDASIGRSDSCSLRIDRRGAGFGRWCATSIGPAFGGKEFVEGSRYRLSAWVRLEKPGAEARLAIRLHREDAEGLFDPDTYEKWYSECAAATGEWCPLEVVTPVIGAHPDRLHLLLELRDGGRAWFDDVEWEELPPEPA